MSTDASEFSLLEEAEKIIKPHIKHLSLKRLRDYVDIHDRADEIGGERLHFTLWENSTMMPAGLEKGAKAYGIDVRRESWGVEFSAGGEYGFPCIEYDRLILYCPTDESIFWLFQEISCGFDEKA